MQVPWNAFVKGNTLRSLKTPNSSKTLEPLKKQAGFIAPRYTTASRTTNALLEAGRKLLRSQRPEDLTIQALCSEAGVTTGAFYGRFKSKDAFLAALLAVLVREVQERMQKNLLALNSATSLREGMGVVMRELRQGIVSYSGVLRVLLFQTGGREIWAPFPERRRELVERLLPIVAHLIGGAPSEAMQERIRFAFQVVIGTLMNAMLHDPGPLLLSDERLEKELTVVFCGYIEAGMEEGIGTPVSNKPTRSPKRNSKAAAHPKVA